MSKHTIYLRDDGEKALKELQDIMKAANPIGLANNTSVVVSHALIKLADDLKKGEK